MDNYIIRDGMSVNEENHLTKDYGSRRGVFDVSFRVTKGDVFGFLEPNGSGKSTTTRYMMGVSKSDRGEARIFGKVSFHRYNEILKNVGYMTGLIALPSGLTGWELSRMMQSIKRIPYHE